MIKTYLIKEYNMLMEHFFSWLTLISNIVLILLLFHICVTDFDIKMLLGLVWVGAIINILVVQEMYFYRDKESGTYSLIAASPYSNYRLLLEFFFSQWIMISAPIVLCVAIGGCLTSMSIKAIASLEAIVVLSLWCLSITSWFANILSLNLSSRAKVLQLTVVVPMYIPAMIFGTSGSYDCLAGIIPLANISMLLAIAITMGMIIPFAVSYLLDEGAILP